MTNVKTAVSAANMEPVLVHAVVQHKARTAETAAETRAANELGVLLVGVVRATPRQRTWRAQAHDGPQVAFVALAASATEDERARFASAIERLEAARDALPGVLPVRALASTRDAFLTDIWTTGTAHDLMALGWALRKRVEFVLSVASSLRALHAAGIVHGCLCPDNVLLDDGLRPLLAEVGMVSVPALLGVHAAALYSEHAAPELQTGAPADARSDVFSVGRMLSDLIAGDAAVPEALRALASRCVAPLAFGRPTTADELVTALEESIQTIPDEVRPVPRPPVTVAPAAAGRPPSAEYDVGGRAPSAPWQPPVAMGIAGVVAALASIGAAAVLGGANDALRGLLGVTLLLGATAASTLVPVPARVRGGRAGVALLLAAAVFVAAPLDHAYRLSARVKMRGDEASRRRAVEQVLRLGRDFRGLSLAHTSLTRLDMAGADLRGVSLAGSDLAGTSLFAAEVDGASFDGAELAGANLEGVELALASVKAARCDDRTGLPAGWACEAGQVVRRHAAP